MFARGSKEKIYMEKSRMSIARAREFFLGAYHDLPNILFIGSLLLGSITGYLPMVWVAVGLIFNGAAVSLLQIITKLLFSDHPWFSMPAGSSACEMFESALPPNTVGGRTMVFPSLWLSSATFFAVFSLYNSIRVSMAAPAESANRDKVDVRRAYSLSVVVISVIFLGLIFARGLSGCETWAGGIAGVVAGTGLAIGYYHILDTCGSGSVPDILQIMNSLPPPGDSENIPVVCTPPP